MFEEDISLKMEWYNSQRLVICTNEVGKAINLNQTNAKAVKESYNSLQFFHKITQYIHEDIFCNPVKINCFETILDLLI
jgi:hypothetical protein